MSGRLQDKVALVTGAGSIGPGWGNGKATAVLFAREGAKIVALDINGQAVEETRASIAEEGGECTVVEADVSEPAAVAAAVRTCLDEYGRLDVLHNNVGIVEAGGVLDESLDSWERAVAVNLRSMFLTIKHAVPAMQRQGGGSIVNLSSIAANRWLGVPYASYSATKSGIIGLTRNVAAQFAPKNIRCNCILPGIIHTPLVDKVVRENFDSKQLEAVIEKRTAQIPMRRMGDAWDVAYAALYLASDEARYVTGQVLGVDGGIVMGS